MVLCMALTLLAVPGLAAEGVRENMQSYTSEEKSVLEVTGFQPEDNEESVTLQTGTRVRLSWLQEDADLAQEVQVTVPSADGQQAVTLTRADNWEGVIELAPEEIQLEEVGISMDVPYVVSFVEGTLLIMLGEGAAEMTEDQVQAQAAEILNTGESRSAVIMTDTSKQTQLAYGDEITLHVQLQGYEGVAYAVRWQRDDGTGWTNIPGETGEDFTFTLDESTELWNIRVEVMETQEN